MNDKIKESVLLRDELAVQRTHLANERTLLAYLRTAILLLATGLTLIKLFAGQKVLLVLGIICIPASLLVAGISYRRYRRFNNEIKKLYQKIDQEKK